MRVRVPNFDVSDLTPLWSPHREFAHRVNSIGIIPSAIEPFLIKVLRRAKTELDPVADAELIADVDLFNRQEAQHYKKHELFNEMVASNGYPGIRDHDQALKDQYNQWFREKDLEWLLGYCEAFESLVAGGAEQWVDYGWGSYLDGADPRMIELWRWHLAEEYEHRTVVHRLFHRLVSGSPDDVYNKRVSGLAFFLEHLPTVVDPLRLYLLSVDRAHMTPEEVAQSQERDAQVEARAEEFFTSVADVMSPDWDPEKLAPPKHLEEVLAWYPD